MLFEKQELIDNYNAVKHRLANASEAAGLTTMPGLLAVSKKHNVDKIRVLAQYGQRDFGESYAQEGVQKISATAALSLEWHFIGPVQSNKAKIIAQHFNWIHSVDREKIIHLLSKHRPQTHQSMNVLLQLKVGDEDSKSGATEDVVSAMAAVIEDTHNLTLRGLMCIPPPSSDFSTQEAYFKQAQDVYQRMKRRYKNIDTLSMGMSGDLEAAVKCGATMVRIGTDIFGQRM